MKKLKSLLRRHRRGPVMLPDPGPETRETP
jgi:hypothetical protein